MKYTIVDWETRLKLTYFVKFWRMLNFYQKSSFSHQTNLDQLAALRNLEIIGSTSMSKAPSGFSVHQTFSYFLRKFPLNFHLFYSSAIGRGFVVDILFQSILPALMYCFETISDSRYFVSILISKIMGKLNIK